MDQAQKISRFDKVKIITTKNVNYLSSRPNTEVIPHGTWTVSAVLNNVDLLCVRDSVLIRIPVKDVLKISSFDVSEITKNFGKLAHGKDKRKRSD